MSCLSTFIPMAWSRVRNHTVLQTQAYANRKNTTTASIAASIAAPNIWNLNAAPNILNNIKFLLFYGGVQFPGVVWVVWYPTPGPHDQGSEMKSLKHGANIHHPARGIGI